jgi:hypothetical protein
MSIQTYAELQTAVANWLDRSDLTVRIPEFIELLEGDLRRRLRKAKTQTSISLGAGTVAMPSGAAEITDPIRVNNGGGASDWIIYPRLYTELQDLRAGAAATGRPRYFCVVDRNILLVPAPDQTYTGEIAYFNAYVSVSASESGLIPTAPDLYLFGTLAMASMYLEHDERVPMWRELYEKALEGLNSQREHEEFETSLRPMRLPVVFG